MIEHLGSWQGSNALRMLPADDFVRGGAAAEVRAVAGGLATQIDYTYSHANGPQWGTLLLCVVRDRADAVFLDTFHQSPGWMILTGVAAADGVEVGASYAPGFDWTIAITWATDSWRLRMSNAMVDAGSYVAVEMVFHR